MHNLLSLIPKACAVSVPQEDLVFCKLALRAGNGKSAFEFVQTKRNPPDNECIFDPGNGSVIKTFCLEVRLLAFPELSTGYALLLAFFPELSNCKMQLEAPEKKLLKWTLS